jgi:hypothetical protein
MTRVHHGFAAILAAAVLSSAACATTTYPSPRERLLNRAAYDLQCPAQALTVTSLDHETRAIQGCGHQATYVLVCDAAIDNVMRRCTWLANTANVTPTDWQVTRAPIASP